MLPSLPGTFAPDGSRILLGRPGLRDPNKSTMDDFARCIYTMVDVLQQEDELVTVAGSTVIVDVTGLSFAHAVQMTAPNIKKMLTIIQVTLLVNSFFENLGKC